MPRRYLSRNFRTVVIFLIILFASAIVSSIVYREYHVGRNAYRDYQSKAQAQQREAANEIAKRCATYGPPSEAIRHCIAEAVRSYQAQANTDEDLQAQKDMAYWGMAVFVTSAVGVLVSTLGLIALIDSLNQTRAAIRNDRQIGQAQVRAYLHVGPVKVNFSDPENNGRVTVKYRIGNAGASPAKNISGWCAVFYGAHDLREVFDKNPIRSSAMIATNAYIESTIKTEVALSRSEINAIEQETHAIWFVARMRYSDVFGKRRLLRFRLLCCGKKHVQTGGMGPADRNYENAGT